MVAAHTFRAPVVRLQINNLEQAAAHQFGRPITIEAA